VLFESAGQRLVALRQLQMSFARRRKVGRHRGVDLLLRPGSIICGVVLHFAPISSLIAML
jgi:hypothetical protein